jgi:hypothetical protein
MILLSAIAHADIPPTPPTNREFASNAVMVEGLEGSPDFVLLLVPAGTSISAYRAFTPERSRQDLSDRMLRADFWLMEKAAYEAWSAATSAEIMRQETACAERGEGCAHISRFVPSFSPPTQAIRCGASLDAPSTVPRGEPTSLLHTFRLTAASATACTVTADTSTPPSVSPGKGCATAGGGVSGLALPLLMLLGLRRRCGS